MASYIKKSLTEYKGDMHRVSPTPTLDLRHELLLGVYRSHPSCLITEVMNCTDEVLVET